MLTAETIEAERAREIGLLHEVVSSAADLDEWERRLRDQLGKVDEQWSDGGGLLVRSNSTPHFDCNPVFHSWHREQSRTQNALSATWIGRRTTVRRLICCDPHFTPACIQSSHPHPHSQPCLTRLLSAWPSSALVLKDKRVWAPFLTKGLRHG